MQLPDNRFILYRREWMADKQKWGKYPCDTVGRKIDPHQPEAWLNRTEAERWATWDESRPSAPYGVGWVLNGDGWFFLDLDNCFVNGAWTSESSAIYQSFGGALGEVSTSGTGLHIFGRCDPSQLADRRNKWDGNKEFYTNARFVALSRGGPQPIGPEARDVDWTHQLLRLVPQREFLGELPDGVDPSYTGPDSDDELIRMALRSSNAAAAFGTGVTFADLWNGNTDTLARKYPAYDGQGGYDRSNADSALMVLLAFWTGKDMPRMDRLFRRSALIRDKYLEREDYRRATIQNAARLCKKVYDQPQKAAPLPSAPPPTRTSSDTSNSTRHEAFLTIPEMITHFEGCVYVRDAHRVLVPDGALLKPDAFAASYGGHMFQIMPDGTKPSKNAFEAFTQNCTYRFPQARGLVFRPDLPFGTILNDGNVNTYLDPRVDMRPGDVSPLTSFLEKLIPDAHDREILISWAAACVQHPGVKFQWAPVLQGTEGNGKTLFASCVAYAVGTQYVHAPNPKQLGTNFNKYLEGKVLILVEEIHMAGRRDVLDDLKAKITNVFLEVEGKGADQRMFENRANWIFCTNHRDAVIKSKNDRRYSIFFTGQQEYEDIDRDGLSGEYFPRLYNWLRSEGGYAFVANWLKTYPIRDELNPATLCHRAPITSSTAEAIASTKGGIEAEIEEAIASGVVGFQGGWVSTWQLLELVKRGGGRIGRSTLGNILRGMGYVEWGRAPRAILAEGGGRSMLWRHKDAGESTFEAYIKDQGPTYT